MIKSKANRISITRVHLYILIALIVNFLFCEYNFKQLLSADIKSKNEILTIGQTMINSIDNECYLTQVDNFLEGKDWRRTPAMGTAGYVRRVPGYATVYFIFKSTFSEDNYLLMLRYFQFFLFGVSCFAFLSLARSFVSEKSALFITLVYSIIPIASVWTYFTLTEALTPALMIFHLYFLIKGWKSSETKSKLWLYSASFLLLICLILTRPYVGLAGIVFAAVVLSELRQRKLNFLHLMFTTLLGFAVWSTWIIRNYIVTGEFVPLEVAYHPQSFDRMKPEFRGMFNLSKAWGEDGAYFNTYHEPFFNAVLDNGFDEKNNEFVLKKYSTQKINEIGRSNLIDVLNSHQKAILAQTNLFVDTSSVNTSYLPIQHATEKKYNKLINKIKSDHPLRFYVTIRFRYLQRLIVHSNTAHIHVFNSPMNIFFKGIKAGLFVFHILGYLCVVLGIIVFLRNRKWIPFIIFAVTPLVFVFFFAFVHREIEQRYMLPVFPIIVLGIAWCYSERKNLFISRR